MPIPNGVLTAAQFDWLQRNITAESDTSSYISSYALSGLNYVVLTDVDQVEVDLVNPFAYHVSTADSFESDSNFTSLVTSLNMHVVTRGTVGGTSETFQDRLNRWLLNNNYGVTYFITKTYARISSGAGFIIDPAYIEP